MATTFIPKYTWLGEYEGITIPPNEEEHISWYAWTVRWSARKQRALAQPLADPGDAMDTCPLSVQFLSFFMQFSEKSRKIIGFCSHLCGIGTPFPSPNPVWEILDLPLISVLSNLSWYYICATYCLVQWNCCHCRFIEEMLFCATSMVVNWRRQTGLGSWTCQTIVITKTSKWENVSIGKEWEFLFPDFRTLILDTKIWSMCQQILHRAEKNAQV